ncbi:MAG: glycosyl hydrolase [Gemmatimonadota bacterium]|nr:MAG: glycosyl hydrolase [Gemmatimonadota bacterium]
MRSPRTVIRCLLGLAIVAPLGIAAGDARAQAYNERLFSALEWRSIGPFRGGRVTAVAGVPSQPYVYYMGVTGGGVWKTVDGGMAWMPVADEYLGAGSIGGIAVAPSDPNVVYVATGETCIRGNTSPGDGMYKSTDAGKTWTHIGLREGGQIGEVRVHPTNPDIVYAAVLGHAFGPNETRGVYRSKDGGATWERVLYRDENAGAVDIVLDPNNPRIIYAALWQARRMPWGMESGGAGSGLFKSTDGGDSWTEISRYRGLPEGTIGKIGIAVSPLNSDRVWAIVEAEEGGVFRSEDAGESWTRVNDDRNLRQRAWYYTHIYADPQNENAVYVLNVSFHKSTDGGRTYETMRTPHGDNHDLWIDPNDALRMIEGNDGGANVTYNGGKTWTQQDNQPTAQFYHVTTTEHFPYHVCGAQQDNSTLCTASRTTGFGITSQDWYTVGGCESGYIAVRPDKPDVSYAGCYGGMISRYDRSTGQSRNIHAWPDNPMGWGAADLKYRFQWTFPIVLSPFDPDELYISANVVFRSRDEGQSWEVISPDLTHNDKSKQVSSGGPITKDNTSVEYYATVFALVPSRHERNTIWAGTDDGRVWITRDGGGNWEEITPRNMPEWGLVSIIEESPHEPGAAYVAVNRYKLDDFAPYIFKTTDYGRSWRRVVRGIPEGHYVRVVREDPERRGLLYAGGEFGVYVSFDDGEHWQSLQLNLPVVPVRDMAVKDNDLVLATHGRSFWILDDLTPLHQLGDEIAGADVQLYKPRATYRMGGFGFFAGFVVPGVGRNPPNGAVVHYYFAEDPDEEVKLAFLEADGTLIREFSSKPERGSEEGDVKVEAGMNRFVWDLRYPDASRFPGMIMWAGTTAGPRAVPGTYQVRITVGDRELSEMFEVLKDPRVDASQADLQEQFDFLIRIRDRVSEANDAVSRIRDIGSQIDAAVGRVAGEPYADEVAEMAKQVKGALSEVENEIYQTKNRSRQDPLNYPIRLNNKLAALTGVVASADARPTQQSYDVFEELSAQLQVQLDRLEQIVATEIPAFNALIAEHEVPAVIVREEEEGSQ